MAKNNSRNIKRQKIAEKRAQQKSMRKSNLKPSLNYVTKSKNLSIVSGFNNFGEVVRYSSTFVYLISRLRQVGGVTQYVSLGTGFLIGEFRFITCAHCIDDVQSSDNPMAHHQDGDVYLLAQRDEIGNSHVVQMSPILNESLFISQENDSAIFYLPQDFYKFNGSEVKDYRSHLEFASKPLNIGNDVGILGYPIQGLQIVNGIPDISSIFLRGDKGVVNARYLTTQQLGFYEFTIPFNPGNSGGPIIDISTGKVIGLVKAFNSIPLRVVKEDIGEKNSKGEIKKISVNSVIRTTYSIGSASENYKIYKDSHLIAYDD